MGLAPTAENPRREGKNGRKEKKSKKTRHATANPLHLRAGEPNLRLMMMILESSQPLNIPDLITGGCYANGGFAGLAFLPFSPS